MAVGGLFKYAQRAFFSKPTPERQLLKLIRGNSIRRVVEIGLESIESTDQLLRALAKEAGEEPIRYTAIDPFDDRADGQPTPLMEVYRRLVATGARVRLIPGELPHGVAAEANSLADTDLLLFSRQAETERGLRSGWYYVPRMCYPGTLALARRDGADADDAGAWETLDPSEILARSQAAEAARAA